MEIGDRVEVVTPLNFYEGRVIDMGAKCVLRNGETQALLIVQKDNGDVAEVHPNFVRLSVA